MQGQGRFVGFSSGKTPKGDAYEIQGYPLAGVCRIMCVPRLPHDEICEVIPGVLSRESDISIKYGEQRGGGVRVLFGLRHKNRVIGVILCLKSVGMIPENEETVGSFMRRLEATGGDALAMRKNFPCKFLERVGMAVFRLDYSISL